MWRSGVRFLSLDFEMSCNTLKVSFHKHDPGGREDQAAQECCGEWGLTLRLTVSLLLGSSMQCGLGTTLGLGGWSVGL